jgi:uncharacterized protein YodC (DUF2158 family)
MNLTQTRRMTLLHLARRVVPRESINIVGLWTFVDSDQRALFGTMVTTMRRSEQTSAGVSMKSWDHFSIFDGLAWEDGMTTEIQVGDVVKLKSGGPAMTITAIDETSKKAFCEWFESTEQHQGTFVLAALEPSNPSDRPKPTVFRD